MPLRTLYLGVSAVVFTKHPFQRTVPLRLHEDLPEAQTPSNTGPSRRAPSPAPLCFKMRLLSLPHTVPLSLMHPTNSRSQSSFLGASILMTRWIDSLLSLRMGTLVAPTSPS